MTYSIAVIELLLANLLQKFNWKLPDGEEDKGLDMSEKPGITMHKGVPLLTVAVAIKGSINLYGSLFPIKSQANLQRKDLFAKRIDLTPRPPSSNEAERLPQATRIKPIL
ncbi:hypothetical protein ACS0TY_019201 [Phlomoides rotata]